MEEGLQRLSVDIGVNYVGAVDRATMTAERPKLDAALEQVASRLGLAVRRAPSEHAGGKWRLSYTSALGRPAILEFDVNYMLRVPLWDPTLRESHELLGVARDTMYRWIEAKDLPAHRVGRHWKFKLNEVDRWVREGGASEAADGPRDNES